MIDPEIKKAIDDAIEADKFQAQYGVSRVPYHTHNNIDSPAIAAGTVSASAAAPDTSLQFNNGGALGGSNLLFDSLGDTISNTTGTPITITGSIGTAGNDGTPVTITSGTGGAGADGGRLTIQTGVGGSTNGSGGPLTLQASSGIGSGNGGSITIQSGSGSVSGSNGGAITITAGSAPNTAGTGGALTIATGDTATGSIGDFIIQGGSSGDDVGGHILIRGGDGFTGGIGVDVEGGDATAGNNTGGGVSLRGGQAHGSAAGGPTLVIGGLGTPNAQVFLGGIIGSGGALATNATGGFIKIPTTAGTPTGTPITHSLSGYATVVYDTSANKIWVYNGGWRSVAVT